MSSAGSTLKEELKHMAGRGPQTFKKRQKEQQRKERQEEKLAKRLQRKANKLAGIVEDDDETVEGDDATEDALESHDESGEPLTAE